MQLKIKHDVVAVTLEKDLQARKGDILVVPSDGVGHPAVLPGLSFEVAITELTKPKRYVATLKGDKVDEPMPGLKKAVEDFARSPILKAQGRPSGDPANSGHYRKHRLMKENIVLTEKEYRYLELLSKYEEPMTTKEIAVLSDESYRSHGAIQTNILRPMVTAKLVRRMHTVSDHQRNGVYGYLITRRGKKVMKENSQLAMKEVV